MNEDQKICLRCKHCRATIEDMGYGYTYAKYYCRLGNFLNGSVCTNFEPKTTKNHGTNINNH